MGRDDYNPKMDTGINGDTGAKKPSGGVWGCLGCLGVVAIVIIAIGVGSAIGGSSKEPYDPNNQYEAIAQCEDLVTGQLKSPTSAEFDSSATSNGNRSWTVTGTVDADNSFGAKIRNTYQCSVRMVNDKIERRLDRLG